MSYLIYPFLPFEQLISLNREETSSQMYDVIMTTKKKIKKFAPKIPCENKTLGKKSRINS